MGVRWTCRWTVVGRLSTSTLPASPIVLPPGPCQKKEKKHIDMAGTVQEPSSTVPENGPRGSSNEPPDALSIQPLLPFNRLECPNCDCAALRLLIEKGR